MVLETKPNLEQVLDRFEAWWHCEPLERPLLTISISGGAPVALPERKPSSIRDAWFDIEYIVACHAAYVEQGTYFADRMPTFIPNLGPDLLSTLFGCELEFSSDTSWSHPIVPGASAVTDIQPQFDGLYWQTIVKLMNASIEAGKGKWVTGYTDLHPNADLVSALVGPQELCMQCIEDPEAVKAACLHITPACNKVYEDSVQLIKQAGLPSTTWLNAPSRGRMYVASCDFSAMISRDMFEELVMPAIELELADKDQVIYHLDGPTALQHLDTLLACKKIDAIQWVYGSGQEPASRWIDVYRKIQAAGKGMQIICDDAADALRVASQIGKAGAWYTVAGSYSLEEAEELWRGLVEA